MSLKKKEKISGSTISHAWRSLRHKNFRLFFTGQSISVIGTWMTRVATGWLVYRLTHSAVLLGTVSFAGQIPTFLLAPFAGVWIDRMDRRSVLLWTQTLAMIQSLALAVLTLTHRITIPEILWLSAFQGAINAFDMPGRQSFLVHMVDDKADLSNAIAMNSSMVNMARLIGPSLAGVVIAATSEGYCFLIDGISYIAVLISLFKMRVSTSNRGRRAASSTLTELRAGWDYVSGSKPLRAILLLFALVSLMGMPYTVLMPIFASQVLKGGPHTLGFLMGAMGLGALISAVSLTLRKTVRGLLKMIPISAGIFGAGLICLGLSHILWLSLLLMLFTGFGMLQGMAVSNTIIQTITSEDMRGRVMSYYTIAFVGMAPFGSLLAGYLAHLIGAPRTVMFTGAFVLMGGILFWLKRQGVRNAMRPIYVELGIVPPKAVANSVSR
jgi:MFS family permease